VLFLVFLDRDDRRDVMVPQKHPQTPPFLIRKVMTIQSIKHRTYLHHPATKIHGTPQGLSGVVITWREKGLVGIAWGW
jgi:hypothetical protein